MSWTERLLGGGALDCHPEQAFFAPREPALSLPKGIWASRAASRFLRRNSRAFGSLPYQISPLPPIGWLRCVSGRTLLRRAGECCLGAGAWFFQLQVKPLFE